MAELQGSLIQFKVRENGTADPLKTLVCTEDTTFNITNEISKRRTNCGVKTGIADAEFTASGNAVYNYTPGGTEVSWDDIKEWQKSKTKLDFVYENDADSPLAQGAALSAVGSGYFTETTFTGSAEADGIGSFSWTFEGTGTLDSFDV